MLFRQYIDSRWQKLHDAGLTLEVDEIWSASQVATETNADSSMTSTFFDR
jgi:hypothetical protein